MKLHLWTNQVRVLEQLLNDRGCTHLHPVCTGQDPFYLCNCRTGKGDILIVFLADECKIGVKTIRKLREECGKQGATNAILVCTDGMTPFAQKEIKSYEEDHNLTVDIFKKAELAFNVTHHHLVPKHIPLSAAQKRELLATLNCKANALPKIKSSDPVIRYLGSPIGTVLQIKRTIGLQEAEIYYRIVIA
jgi:DNA-directed RNA polymerases I, II, and III subunit RPABC1